MFFPWDKKKGEEEEKKEKKYFRLLMRGRDSFVEISIRGWKFVPLP